ncbi:AI-2E family transporter [bacterium]|nr:AI-2E family transporter [bacterium]
MKTVHRIEQIGGITAIVLVFLGCFAVLKPFVSALIWAAILCYATWPCYRWLHRAVRGRRTIAAALMVLMIAAVMVLPFAIAVTTLAENASRAARMIQQIQEHGVPEPPAWVGQTPLVGKYVNEYWQGLAESTERTTEVLKDVFMWSKNWIVKHSVGLGQGIFQLSVSVLVAFFFYRSGEKVGSQVQAGVQRLMGETTQRLLLAVGGTIKGVVYGIIGTALAQGILAGVGFWIADVPGAYFWALLTFFFSLVPNGPPLIWIPATIWLFYTGHTGWGIFMALWGLLVISGVDNFLRPYLISRGSPLPFVLVFLGVLGGIMAFGFIGVFIGPTLLAAGYSLVDEVITHRAGAANEDKAPESGADGGAGGAASGITC